LGLLSFLLRRWENGERWYSSFLLSAIFFIWHLALGTKRVLLWKVFIAGGMEEEERRRKEGIDASNDGYT